MVAWHVGRPTTHRTKPTQTPCTVRPYVLYVSAYFHTARQETLHLTYHRYPRLLPAQCVCVCVVMVCAQLSDGQEGVYLMREPPYGNEGGSHLPMAADTQVYQVSGNVNMSSCDRLTGVSTRH